MLVGNIVLDRMAEFQIEETPDGYEFGVDLLRQEMPVIYSDGTHEIVPPCAKTRLVMTRKGEVVNNGADFIYYGCTYSNGKCIEQWSQNVFYNRVSIKDSSEWVEALRNYFRVNI